MNRLIWMQPDGEFAIYDKRHLFRLMDEDKTFSPGEMRLVVEWKGWKICPMVCYDLRFPVWSRNTPLDYDLLLFVANWPSPRLNAWDTLLKARAIENLAYCAGVNRVGSDGNDVPFTGHSAMIDFKGNELIFLGETEGIQTVTLDYEALHRFRKKFPVDRDADLFELRSV
jgi:predicted amidohydrolase